MSLRESVKEIFNQNSEYKNAHQAANQAASLKSLSSDLYTDSKRFIYELLQNADDSSVDEAKVKVGIKLFGDKLIVAHNGKPFDDRDVRGIAGVGDGVKTNSPDKTGFKGIGFKAVFGQSNNVVIFSKNEYFRFDATYEHPWQWAGTKEAWEAETKRQYKMPWHIIPIFTEVTEIDSEIDKLLTTNEWTVATIVTLNKVEITKNGILDLIKDVNMFLFLKHIELIQVDVDDEVIIEITEIEGDQTILFVNKIEKARWLKHTITLDVPEDLTKLLENDTEMPDKLKFATKIDITLAAKNTAEGISNLEANERLLYSYLPTEESRYEIPVLVNGAFYMAANRESLHRESPWNEWLFACIPEELLKWIGKLISQGKQEAYNILPDKLTTLDPLADAYNKSREYSLATIPIILNTENKLLKVSEAIVDFTFLSTREIVGGDAIRNFIITDWGLNQINLKPFVSAAGYGNKLRKIGVAVFQWGHMAKLLATPEFAKGHTVTDNNDLINYLMAASHNDKITDVTDNTLTNWPFILNQNNKLKPPKDVFFPAADEAVNPTSNLSFVHPDLQKSLDNNASTKAWLESLGVVEKTDVTFLLKNIIPNAANHCTPSNAVETIRKIFNLFSKGDIGVEVLDQLKNIKLLTTSGTMLKATQCYLSDQYLPRLSLQSILKEDLYVTDHYISGGSDVRDWKSFFQYLGVNEGIELIVYSDRLTNQNLLSLGVKQGYISRPEHKYTWQNSYWVEEIRGLTTLALLRYTTSNHDFACIFWKDIITHKNPSKLEEPSTVYYGRPGKNSQINGDEVPNYLKWYVTNEATMPNSTNIPQSTANIFLNTPENIKIGGVYLPVFDGPELNADWKAFFKFKSRLTLEDYLLLLTKLSEDPAGDNKNRTQAIYENLLEKYNNWDTANQQLLQDWAATGELADIYGVYRRSTELKYYMDGNHNIFGDTYNFIQLGVNAKRHSDIEGLLLLFGVEILRQDQFAIKTSEDLTTSSLKNKLEEVLPFWAKWMERERASGYDEMLSDLELKLSKLKILQASEIRITYGEDWSKKVMIHYDNDSLYVQNDWASTKVMYVLPDKLCEIFPVKNYSREIGFLIGSDISQIKEHFEELGIQLPPLPEETLQNQNDLAAKSPSPQPVHDFSPKPKADYQSHWMQSLLRNKALIDEFGTDAATLLIEGLTTHHKCTELEIYHFSHIENAVSIIREGAIKSRKDAIFKDSAGSGIIAQTDPERKVFARFYFRPKTPTQYYIENLGKSNVSIANISSDPLCPVPVFFALPLVNVMAQNDWSVSIGSLASPQVEFGNNLNIVSQFDFDGVYKTLQEISWPRFRIAAHQEFLVRDQLDLTTIDYHLIVQDVNAKESLLSMLGELADDWRTRITINPEFYNNENPKVEIKVTENTFKASLSRSHNGYFILQHSSGQEWEAITGQIDKQYNTGDLITTFFGKELFFKGELATVAYKLFYFYKGRIWLIQSNTTDIKFEAGFAKVALDEWFAGSANDVDGLIRCLKVHPELEYYFSQPIGGPDDLSLEEHTVEVINNYNQYFGHQQLLFANHKEYLFCLALHDIGKPAAVAEGDRHLQHGKTLEIIARLRDIFPISDDSLEKMKILINADPIGKYLNRSITYTSEEACSEILKMQKASGIPFQEFIKTLVIYYQCDAAGYNSLQDKLFLPDENRKLSQVEDNSRLLFKEYYETKFKALIDTVTHL